MSTVSTHWGGDVDEVRLQSDERGFELVVETNSGTYLFNIHGVSHNREFSGQLQEVARQLDEWWDEGLQAAREHERERVLTPEEAGYDPTDPKSPGYHDRMVDSEAYRVADPADMEPGPWERGDHTP